MNSVNNFVGNVGKGFDKAFGVVAYSVSRSDALEKIAKITDRIIRFADTAFGSLSSSMTNFGAQLRDTIIVFETLRFIGVMNILLTPNKEGKFFLTDPRNSWQKRTDRVTLAFHTAFKMVKGFNKFGFVDLGFMAKNVIGKLPIFTLAMDSFIIASSFFSSWDSFINLGKVNERLAEAKAKYDKWEYRPTSVAYLKINDEVELKGCEEEFNLKAKKLHDNQDKLEKEVRLHEDKLAKIAAGDSKHPKAKQVKIEKESTAKITELSLGINKIAGKIEKNEGRIAKIAERNFQGLAADLDKADANFKLKKWEVMKSNAVQARTKVWFNIANAIGKIAVVTFALVVAAANAFAVVPVALSLLAMGIVVDSIGLTKILLTDLWTAKPVPKPQAAPRFEAIRV